jgi:hypothetical protein
MRFVWQQDAPSLVNMGLNPAAQAQSGIYAAKVDFVARCVPGSEIIAAAACDGSQAPLATDERIPVRFIYMYIDNRGAVLAERGPPGECAMPPLVPLPLKRRLFC